jgi:serine acetyltransferase
VADEQTVRTDNGAGPAKQPQLGTFQLIREDYRAFSRLRGDRSSLKRRLLFLPRLFTNPSLHAVVLLRFSMGCPPWAFWFWRNILIWKHSMDVAYRSDIGPGLFLPHPHTISMAPGVTIGARCRILHMTNIGGNVGSEGGPVIGDGVVILLGATILGEVTVGDGCVVGANAWVDQDMPPGSIAVAPKSTIIEGKAEKLFGSSGILQM